MQKNMRGKSTKEIEKQIAAELTRRLLLRAPQDWNDLATKLRESFVEVPEPKIEWGLVLQDFYRGVRIALIENRKGNFAGPQHRRARITEALMAGRALRSLKSLVAFQEKFWRHSEPESPDDKRAIASLTEKKLQETAKAREEFQEAARRYAQGNSLVRPFYPSRATVLEVMGQERRSPLTPESISFINQAIPEP